MQYGTVCPEALERRMVGLGNSPSKCEGEKNQELKSVAKRSYDWKPGEGKVRGPQERIRVGESRRCLRCSEKYALS